jgi:hypothetical protein
MPLQDDRLENIDLNETENICIIDLNSWGGEPGETHINLSGINPGSVRSTPGKGTQMSRFTIDAHQSLRTVLCEF